MQQKDQVTTNPHRLAEGEDSENSCVTQYLWVFITFNIIIMMISGLIMALTFYKRWRQLSNMAYPKQIPKPYIFYFRQLLLILYSVFFLVEIIVDVGDDGSWVVCMNKVLYVFLSIFLILVNLAQIYILRLQYTQSVPIMWPHKAFWVTNLLSNIISLIFLVLQVKIEKVSIILPSIFFRAMKFLNYGSYHSLRHSSCQFSRLQVYFFTDKTLCSTKNTTAVQESMRVSWILSNLKRKFKNIEHLEVFIINFAIAFSNFLESYRPNQPVISQFLKVEVGKNIAFQQTNITIKLIVTLPDDKTIKLQKTIDEFIELEKRVTEELDMDCDNERCSVVDRNNFKNFNFQEQILEMNTTDSLNENLQLIDKFIQLISSNLAYYTKSFMNFICLEKGYQAEIEKEKHKVKDIKIFEESQNGESQILELKRNSVGKFETSGEIFFLCQSIEVKNFDSHTQYVFEIIFPKRKSNSLSELLVPPTQNNNNNNGGSEFETNKIWQISQRYTDFQQLHEFLIRETQKVKVPQIPSQLDNDVYKRQVKFEWLLKTILNQPEFYCETLWNFIELDQHLFRGQIQQLAEGEKDFLEFKNITQLRAIQQEHVEVQGLDNVLYTSYIFSIELNIGLNEFQNLYQIQKRFSNFQELHELLLLRYPATKLPVLPTQLQSFASNTTRNFRLNQFEKYLNSLLKIDDIYQSFAFRNFIEFSPKYISKMISSSTNLGISGNQPSQSSATHSSTNWVIHHREQDDDRVVNSLQIQGLSSPRAFKRASPNNNTQSDEFFQF